MTNSPPPDGDTTKTFSLGALLSATSGILASDFSEMHELLEHVAGGPVWTHEMPTVFGPISAALISQFPALENRQPTQTQRDHGKAGMRAWIAEVAAETGLPLRVEVLRASLQLGAERAQAWAAIRDKAIVVEFPEVAG